MKINTLLSFAVIFCFTTFSMVISEDFTPLGARAQGMGNVGVAVVKGGKGVYYNPGRLDIESKINITAPYNFSYSVEGEALDMIEKLEELPDFDALEASYEDGFDPTDAQDAANLSTALDLLFNDVLELNGNDGLYISQNAGLFGSFKTKIGTFGFGASSRAYLSVAGVIDLDFGEITLNSDDFDVTESLDDVFPNPENTINDISNENQEGAQTILDSLLESNAITESTDRAALEEMLFQADKAGVDLNNKTVQEAINDVVSITQGVQFGDETDVEIKTLDEALEDTGFYGRGIVLNTFSLSYSKSFQEAKYGIGATINLYHGTTFSKFFNVEEIENYDVPENFQDFQDQHKNDFEETINVGLDIGLHYRPFKGISLGLVARDINAPSFDFKQGGHYDLKPQLRIGASYQKKFKLFSFLLASDLDLIPNETDAFPGNDYQQFAIGSEVLLMKFLFLRIGYNKLLDPASGSGALFTGGVGLRVSSFRLDVAGAISEDSANIEDNDIPARAGLSLELQWNKSF